MMPPSTYSAFVIRAATTILWTTSLVNGQSVKLFYFTRAENATLTTTCEAVLNQNVTCDASLLGLETQFGLPYGLPPLLPASQLTSLCTAQCAASLASWERRIQGACGGTEYWPNLNGDGGSFLPSLVAETYLEIYNSICLTNSAGALCNTNIASALSFDATNQKFTATPPTSAICNTCVLSALQTQLAMPLASKPDISSMFKSWTSSCKSTTGFSPKPTPTGTTFTISATAMPSPTCAGKIYTLKSSDTCQSVSTSQEISTADMIWENNLTSHCENFPTSGTLCIPSAANCEPYTVLGTDTCSSIQSKFGILYSQLISWNPSLGIGCQALNSTVGLVICVSTPGGGWINPNTSDVSTIAPPPSTLQTPTLLTGALTAMSALPTATYVPYSTNKTTPYANNTRLDCTSYITAPFRVNVTSVNGTSVITTSSSCSAAAAAYGVSLLDFLLWNPGLGNDTTSCTLTPMRQYCAQITSARAEDVTDACVKFQIPSPGYDCDNFMAQSGIEPSEFVRWNPSVGSDCSKFSPGTEYCVGVYHYKQPGITTNCNLFAVANDTNWAHQPCQIIETKFGLSHARFVAWNPAVLTNCTEMYSGYDYCVSIPHYVPTYTTTTTAVAKLATATGPGIITTGTASLASTTASAVKTTSGEKGIE
ncbi:hypothetical protein GGR57DRAFT_404025 [Xylariaceae sp. FL1272]|nr:hypothetical protein GGR57DRAFT_404025 [Xylariaceae sp. FL1272]